MKNETLKEIFPSDSEIDAEYSNPNAPYLFTLSIILLVIFIIGIVLNIISIIHLAKCKRLQPINIFIANLAIADLIYIMGKLKSIIFIKRI